MILLMAVIQNTVSGAVGQVTSQFTTHKLGRRFGRALFCAFGASLAMGHFPGRVAELPGIGEYAGIPAHWNHWADAWNEWAGVALAFIPPFWNLDGKNGESENIPPSTGAVVVRVLLYIVITGIAFSLVRLGR